MKENTPNIVLNPIKEIIFSISFANNINLECLNKFVELQEIKDAFPVKKQGFNANLKNIGDDKPPVTDIQKVGYILKYDEPYNRILQAKIGLFAFHKTKEYQEYNKLIIELDKYWDLLQKCTGSLSVTSVTLRYLNFIEIQEGECENDYVSIAVSSPFTEILNSLTQIKFKTPEDNNTEATVVVTKAKDGEKNGLILDIILNRKTTTNEFDKIEVAFDKMREIKNYIFQQAIKTKTKLKYNI